ncbi:hypothetical protein [Sporosarcina sp. NPDC096371]|uniref:hypothetical protein n=1 Tax=Sporosarcina sp. NPDC096371 TaxID=3364530 RepID=UPI00381A8125
MKKIIVVVLLSLLLASCQSTSPSNQSDEGGSDKGSHEVDTQGNEKENEVAKEEEEVEEITLDTPQSCEGIVFEIGRTIEGKKLAACMRDAMIAAGSGSHKVQTSTATSKVDFNWTPDFSMHVETEDTAVILKGNYGWMKLPGSGWIEEKDNPLDVDEVIASNTIKLTRIFGNPEMISGNFRGSKTWRVVEQGAVPDEEAFVDTAWHLVPEETIQMDGVVLTDIHLWLTSNYLGAYYIATASVAGISETTSNTFLQWGEPVEIPNPGTE